MSVKGFKLDNGNVVRYDYSALDNIVTDATLSVAGTAADAAAVGNGLSEVQFGLESLTSQIATTTQTLNDKIDGAYADSDGYLYLTSNGSIAVGPIGPFAGGGGGGGGGVVAPAVFTASNTSGWVSKTISDGTEVTANFTWSSRENDFATGDGAVQITVNEVLKGIKQVPQGSFTLDLTPYIVAGATNKIKIRISDVYDQAQTFVLTVASITLALSSTFDTSIPFDSSFAFPYTPIGSVVKTVYFIVDGNQVGLTQTSVSNRQLSYIIPAQSHGAHSLRVYFEADINGETVRSNELYYEFMSIEANVTRSVIASSFTTTSVEQYALVSIPYRVYTPNATETEITLYLNGYVLTTLTVDRTERNYTLRADRPGQMTFTIRAGNVSKDITFTVNASSMNVEAWDHDLALYLNANGRSNDEEKRSEWKYNDISATLTGFNWLFDGWQTDKEGIEVLRLSGDARVTIPYNIFANDFKSNGKTIEIEFGTKDVSDYSAEILTCWTEGIGLKITSQQVLFKGAQTELSTLYKDNEHLRLSIVVEKQTTETRLILIYINGILSRAIQYAAGERFSQSAPVGISIGSDDCGVDIYKIRVYDVDLNRQQVLTNWIADTEIGSVMLDRYSHNNVYDDGGNITIENLPTDLPYMVLNAEILPQYKGDKKTITGRYVDPVYPSRSFTFEGCQINVQGTSSSVYFRKNYDLQFKNGFITPNGIAENYALRSGSIPFNRFVLKADVASSESANNTKLTMFYNDTCPYKTPEMRADDAVRWGIEGIPIVLFWYDPASDKTEFLGKYNFNLPKRAPTPYGFSGDMESWEFQWNNTANVKFQDDDFTTQKWDETNQKYYPAWYDDWEARFPSDEWRDTTKLKTFISWVKSTWRNAATNAALSSSVTYRVPTTITLNAYGSDTSYTVTEVSQGGVTTAYDITFTKDTPAYRLTKFRAELGNYAEIESATFYYLFTEMWLMIDSWAKNMFIGFNGETCSVPNIDRKVTFQPYDMDTALGTNNSGVLMFGYYHESTDTVSSIISGDTSGAAEANVFNAQDSVMWSNFRDSFRPEIVAMYTTLRTNGSWSYQIVEKMFEDHQAIWPEAIVNEDAYVKYIYPVDHPVSEDPATGQLVKTTDYLTMLQGLKTEQRKWWLYNRFRYMDSKFIVGDAANTVLSIRLFGREWLHVTPAIDMYVSVRFGLGSTALVKRTFANEVADFKYDEDTTVQEFETAIYSGDFITDLGDLSPFHPNEVKFAYATRLKRLQLGSGASGYQNTNLNSLNVNNSPLLEYIDVRNCPNLKITVDLENSTRLKTALFDGSGITGVDLADGCLIETLHLPASITVLTLLNLNKLTDLTITSYNNVTRLMLANIDESILNPITVLQTIRNAHPNNNTNICQVNIQGFYYEAADFEEIVDLYNLFDTMNGVTREKNASGEWIYHEHSTAQISGEIHTDAELTGSEIALLENKYPYITITSSSVTSTVTFMTWDGSSVVGTVHYVNGYPQEVWPNNPSRTATAQWSYTFVGWNLDMDSDTDDPYALMNVIANRTVYAAYSRTLRTYTVIWRNDNNSTLETDTNVPYGTMPTYDGATPVSGEKVFKGWNPTPAPITGNTTYTATYIPTYEVRFYDFDGTLLDTKVVLQGNITTFPANPTSEFGTFVGWGPDYSETPITRNVDAYAQYDFTMTEPDLKYLIYTLDNTNMTMTITGLNTSAIVSDELKVLTIPDTINGYHVIIG